jgi:hypothetical protein
MEYNKIKSFRTSTNMKSGKEKGTTFYRASTYDKTMWNDLLQFPKGKEMAEFSELCRKSFDAFKIIKGQAYAKIRIYYTLDGSQWEIMDNDVITFTNIKENENEKVNLPIVFITPWVVWGIQAFAALTVAGLAYLAYKASQTYIDPPFEILDINSLNSDLGVSSVLTTFLAELIKGSNLKKDRSKKPQDIVIQIFYSERLTLGQNEFIQNQKNMNARTIVNNLFDQTMGFDPEHLHLCIEGLALPFVNPGKSHLDPILVSGGWNVAERLDPSTNKPFFLLSAHDLKQVPKKKELKATIKEKILLSISKAIEETDGQYRGNDKIELLANLRLLLSLYS